MLEAPLEIPGSSEESEAEDIEMRAADRSYRAGLGVTEWETFLTRDEVARLTTLAKSGFGTWGHERNRS